MSEPYFGTGNKRDAVCHLCSERVTQTESRGMYGSGPTWTTKEHDAPCGRPCMGASVWPRGVRERFGVDDYSVAIHGGMGEDRMRRCPVCGDLGVAPPPPPPVVDPHEDGGGFDDLLVCDYVSPRHGMLSRADRNRERRGEAVRRWPIGRPRVTRRERDRDAQDAAAGWDW